MKTLIFEFINIWENVARKAEFDGLNGNYTVLLLHLTMGIYFAATLRLSQFIKHEPTK